MRTDEGLWASNEVLSFIIQKLTSLEHIRRDIMNSLKKWFNILIKKRRELKRWQRVVTVLAAVITFATTYALILPAIAVERDNTGDVGGMYLEQGADQDGADPAVFANRTSRVGEIQYPWSGRRCCGKSYKGFLLWQNGGSQCPVIAF